MYPAADLGNRDGNPDRRSASDHVPSATFRGFLREEAVTRARIDLKRRLMSLAPPSGRKSAPLRVMDRGLEKDRGESEPVRSSRDRDAARWRAGLALPSDYLDLVFAQELYVVRVCKVDEHRRASNRT